MPSPMAGTTPNMEQNPKSILADRNHPTRYPAEKANDHNNSPRVTFAKVTANKQNHNIVGSATSVSPSLDPVQKTGTPNLAAKVKSPVDISSANRSTPNNPTTSVRNEGGPKPQITPPQSRGKQAGDNAFTMVPVRKSELEKTLKQNPNVRKAFADWLSPGANRNSKRDGAAASTSLTSSRRSLETIASTGKESARSTDTSAKRVHSKKSRKRMQKLTKPSSSSVGGGTKRSKSGKKLKRSKKSSEKQEDDKDLESFKPAPLDAEYATELHKISQILTAVTGSNYNVNVPTSGISHAGVSPPIKISSGTEGIGKRQLPGHPVHRPLSGDELKQLLSSITRVVSLHQLPVSEQNSHSGTVSGSNFPSGKFSVGDTANRLRTELQYHFDVSEDEKAANASTSTTDRKSKKKKRKIKKSTLLASKNQEATKSKSRLVNILSVKSKTSTRKGRPKVKSGDKSISRKSRSNNSSVSSLEKDPVKNAAFLRKYYEESTRLANKKSSEEFIPENQLILPEEPLPPQKKTKSKSSKTPAEATISSKVLSVRSIPTKSSQLSSLKDQGSVGSKTSDKKEISKEEARKATTSDNSKNLHQSYTRTLHAPTMSSKPKRIESRGKSHRIQSNISTTAVAGSPKPVSPPENQGDGENIFGKGNIEFSKKLILDSVNYPTIAQMAAVKTKTHTVIPNAGMGAVGSNSAGKQDQFKSIEEVINSRVSAHAKSVWEKTPYQPMTHARFKDMVSKYASPEATIALAQAGENRQVIQGSPKIPVGENPGPAPGNLLSLPKHWEIKEKLTEEAQKDVKQLQGPPKNWPDSATTSTYNRLDMDHRYNMNKDIRTARNFRKMLREDDLKNRAYIPSKDEYLMSNALGGQNELVDSIKFYRNVMKGNTNKKAYY